MRFLIIAVFAIGLHYFNKKQKFRLAGLFGALAALVFMSNGDEFCLWMGGSLSIMYVLQIIRGKDVFAKVRKKPKPKKVEPAEIVEIEEVPIASNNTAALATDNATPPITTRIIEKHYINTNSDKGILDYIFYVFIALVLLKFLVPFLEMIFIAVATSSH